MKPGSASGVQQQLDFSPPRPRPFLSNLPARIDTYEEGVAGFFRWRTGLDYYATIDQVADFVLTTRCQKIIDFPTDTGTFALRLAGRKGFSGRIYSFDSNVTLTERARQRALHRNLHQLLEFRECEGGAIPLPDGFADGAVSIFDFHRHSPRQFLSEAFRILARDGHLIVAEMLEPKSLSNRLQWTWMQLHLKYVQKKRSEAEAVYLDSEEMIQILFETGFRQVIIQGLKAGLSPGGGTFSLVTATK